MNFSRASALVAASVLAVSLARCSSSPKPGTCVPGQSIACTGANACSGSQVCNAQGTYDSCVCGATDGGGTPDSGNSSDAGGTDGGGGNPCTAYTTTTIATMRQGSAGCYRLASVLNLAVTQSTNPRMYVQDMGGADYSAIVATCVASSPTHPCSFASQLRNVAQAAQLNLTGEYVKDATTGVEQFQLDSYANVGQGALGAASTAPPSGIQRTASSRNLAYQRVTVNLSTPLVMFDWSPPEFVAAGAACPYQLGFGLIPAGGGVSGAPCANATSQPAGMATVAPAEVLVSTELAPGFTISSDCRCASSVPTTNSSVSGQVGGILSFAAAPGADAGFFYLAPTSNTDLQLGGLAPP